MYDVVKSSRADCLRCRTFAASASAAGREIADDKHPHKFPDISSLVRKPRRALVYILLLPLFGN